MASDDFVIGQARSLGYAWGVLETTALRLRGMTIQFSYSEEIVRECTTLAKDLDASIKRISDMHHGVPGAPPNQTSSDLLKCHVCFNDTTPSRRWTYECGTHCWTHSTAPCIDVG